MKVLTTDPIFPAFGRRRAWRAAFLAIARQVENAPPEAFRPPVSPVRRIPLAGPRART